MGVDGGTTSDDAPIAAFLTRYITTRLQPSEIDPDVWLPVLIRDPSDTASKLAGVATAKYSYAQLEEYTDLIGRTLLGVPETSRFERKGVISQAIYLEYSQERLASYGLEVSDLSKILNARNITQPSGSLQAGGADHSRRSLRRVRERECDRRRRRDDGAERRARVPARPGANQPRLPHARRLPELLHVDRSGGPGASQPRDHRRALHAIGRADSADSARQSTASSPS